MCGCRGIVCEAGTAVATSLKALILITVVGSLLRTGVSLGASDAACFGFPRWQAALRRVFIMEHHVSGPCHVALRSILSVQVG